MSIPEPEPPPSPKSPMFKRISQLVCPPSPKVNIPVILNEIIIQNDTLREIVVVR